MRPNTQKEHTMYVRFAEHDDRNGQLRKLVFIGPFGDRAAAQKWIENHGGKPVEWDYNDPNNIGAWATNPDEPLEVFEIVQEIPVEAP